MRVRARARGRVTKSVDHAAPLIAKLAHSTLPRGRRNRPRYSYLTPAERWFMRRLDEIIEMVRRGELEERDPFPDDSGPYDPAEDDEDDELRDAMKGPAPDS